MGLRCGDDPTVDERHYPALPFESGPLGSMERGNSPIVRDDIQARADHILEETQDPLALGRRRKPQTTV